jgi:YD repeat-containing protein
MKDRLAKEKTYDLSNYTEYTYDSLGRKISMITRVVPDEKEKK